MYSVTSLSESRVMQNLAKVRSSLPEMVVSCAAHHLHPYKKTHMKHLSVYDVIRWVRTNQQQEIVPR